MERAETGIGNRDGGIVRAGVRHRIGGGGGNSKKSSEAKMTALTVTVGDVDYTAHISGDTATVTLPSGTAIPGSVTVKSVTLSAKATGVKSGDTITLTDGQGGITITAEDGTTGKYTLTVRQSVAAQVLPKGTDEYRAHAQGFVLSAVEEKDYRLALKEAGAAPGASELRHSSATLVRTLGPTAIKVIMSFTMDTNFFDAGTDWTSAEYTAGTKAVKNEKVTPVLLQPGTDYSLYAVEEDGGGDVHKLLDFTTDAVPSTNVGWYGHFPGEHTFTVRDGEPFLLALSHTGPLNGSFVTRVMSTTVVTCSHAITDSASVSPGADAYPFYFGSRLDSHITVSMFVKALQTGDAPISGQSPFTVEYEHGTGDITELQLTVQE